MGVVMGRDEKVNIPHMYIKLVMDLDKVRNFHSGLHSYDFLLSSMEKARKKLGNKKSYLLEGFTYAFQIWIMEAVSDIGKILGKRVREGFIGPRCRNWTGAAKVSYDDIIQIDDPFSKKGDLFSFISLTGNGDVCLDSAYTRKDEMEDERVELILSKVRAKFDWSSTEWAVLEPEETEMDEDEEEDTVSEADKADTDVPSDVETSSVCAARKGKRRIQDEGAETRKKKLLCKRSAEKKLIVDSETKSFIEGLIHTFVNSLGDRLSTQMANMENGFTERMGKMEREVSQLREAIHLSGERCGPSINEAEPAPPKCKSDQPPAMSKAYQAPPKRKADQPPAKKKVQPKRKCKT